VRNRLTLANCLPVDRAQATLIGRVWSPAVAGPVLVLVRDETVVDLSRVAPTMQGLLEIDDPVAAIRAAGNFPRIGTIWERHWLPAWPRSPVRCAP
jgi:fumarylacetoacetate (FAA) hydrolase family protein